MNVHSHPVAKRSTSETGSSTVAGGAQPPYDENMENRVAKLEEFAVETRERLVRIETRLDQMPTKADLAGVKSELCTEMHKGFADTIKWMVGTAVVLGATGITVMTFVLNYGAPRLPAAAPAPQPIIIQMPAPAAAPR